MYSQNDEERVIVEYFAQRIGVGAFLDIGAWDGKTFSNTYRLAELGWRGIAVEPNPLIQVALQKNLAGFPMVEILPMALADVTGPVIMQCTRDAVSTLDPVHHAKWAPHVEDFEEHTVDAITWHDLIDAVGDDFDFVNLDVEGTNVALFDAFPFDRLPFLQMVCVEYDGEPARCAAKAKVYGFHEIHRTGENLIFAK